MAEAIAIVVAIALCLLALWVGVMIVVGAVSTWEDWGPVVLLGWIFAFPFMLVICFLAGLAEYPSSSEIGNGRAGIKPSSPKPRYFGDSTDRPTNQEALNEDELEAVGVELVVVFEKRILQPDWSQHNFRRWAMKLKPSRLEYIGGWYRGRYENNRLDDIYILSAPCVAKWQSSSYFTRESFIERLPYPEYVPSDLERAIEESVTEADFKRDYKNLIAAFDHKYPKKPAWRRQEEAAEAKIREEQEEEERREEVRMRLRTQRVKNKE